MPELLPYSLRLFVLLLLTTVVCDVVHALLHAAQHTQVRLFRAIASLHQEHHEFLDRALRFHDGLLWRNLARHQLPELGMRTLVLVLAGHLLQAGAVVVAAGVLLCVIDLVVVVVVRGRDGFHKEARPVKAPGSGLFVDGSYHALHHAFPDHFLCAHVQLLDRVLGRLMPLRDRAVVVVGGSSYCSDLARACAADHALVTQVDVEQLTDTLLARADVVVLGTGAGSRGHASYEVLLQRAQRAHRDRLLPLEVWTVGTSAAWSARQHLLVDERTILRTLKRGTVIGASTTLQLLRRGARSV
ncbi:MAG: hypothetical protein Q8O67_25475 [Deltaproteobacteria bacterium]|nr:hypothetical protein [Deltaproteobacteria bacterium]